MTPAEQGIAAAIMDDQKRQEDKEWVIDRYVTRTIDCMDFETLEETLRYYMTKDLRKETYEDIVAEAKDFFPDNFTDL